MHGWNDVLYDRPRAIAAFMLVLIFAVFTLGHMLIKANSRWPTLATPQRRLFPAFGGMQELRAALVEAPVEAEKQSESENSKPEEPVATILGWDGVASV